MKCHKEVDHRKSSPKTVLELKKTALRLRSKKIPVKEIVEITGREPAFFRPPYIAVNQTLHDNVDLTFICGAGCEDWVPTVSAQERINRILAHAEDGQIVLLHDMPGNVNTVEALKVIIPELKKRGYEFVTISQLFKEAEVTPVRNRLYSNVYQTTDEPHNPD